MVKKVNRLPKLKIPEKNTIATVLTERVLVRELCTLARIDSPVCAQDQPMRHAVRGLDIMINTELKSGQDCPRDRAYGPKLLENRGPLSRT